MTITRLLAAPETQREVTPSGARQAFLLLRTVFTIAPIAFGLDKFFDLLTDWEHYLAPWINDIVPGSAHQAMLAVGVVEVLAGLLVAWRPAIGAYVVAGWLLGIIVNLLSIGDYYDIALRDFGLLVGALALARLAAPARFCGLGTPVGHAREAGRAMTQQRTLEGPASEASATVLTWRSSVTHDAAPVDLLAAERAATDLLRALGQPIGSDGMVETPRRMAQAYAEMLTSDSFDFTTFANAESYDELVVVEDIPVRSVCEHHMLPFVGVAHLGYLPADRILGLSKLARLVEFYAHRAQTQERLTQQIAEHLDRHLSPRGVGVVIEAEHTCMSLRGVRSDGTRTVTSALLGTLRTDPASRAEFLSLTRARRGCRP